MFSIVARAAGWLAVVAFAGVVLLWQWAAANPWTAVALAVAVVAYVWYAIHLDRIKRAERLTDSHVPDMSPLEYEQFVARLLVAAGWSAQCVGAVGDQGCDVLAERNGFKAVVQCKNYRGRVGNAAVQEVIGARLHYGAQLMAVVSPAGFTPSAKELAASNGVHLLHHSGIQALAGLARVP